MTRTLADEHCENDEATGGRDRHTPPDNGTIRSQLGENSETIVRRSATGDVMNDEDDPVLGKQIHQPNLLSGHPCLRM